MSEYYYLISSLPMLRFGEPAPVTVGDFMSDCEKWLSKKEMARLEAASLAPSAEEESSSRTLASWNAWETSLRNRVARQRAGAVKKDPAPYLRPESDWFSEIERGVQEAYAAANPRERERVLDQLRWKKLEDAESGHTFDFDWLCVYKLKLLLNGKWATENREEGERNLNAIIENVTRTTVTKKEA